MRLRERLDDVGSGSTQSAWQRMCHSGAYGSRHQDGAHSGEQDWEAELGMEWSRSESEAGSSKTWSMNVRAVFRDKRARMYAEGRGSVSYHTRETR